MRNTLISLCTVISFSSILIPPALTGRWKVHDPRGPEYGINFRSDNTYTAYTGSGKVVVTGNFRTDKDTFLLNDLNCNAAYWGKYHLNYITDDSLIIQLINDTCAGRAGAVNGIILARLKKN